MSSTTSSLGATNSTDDILTSYRNRRAELDKLASAARKAMQTRFIALLVEAAEIASDYKRDFGAAPELPAGIKSFTVGDKTKKAAPVPSPGKKVGGLRRSLAAAERNLADAQANNQPYATINSFHTRIAELKAALAEFTGTNTPTPQPIPEPAPASEQQPELFSAEAA